MQKIGKVLIPGFKGLKLKIELDIQFFQIQHILIIKSTLSVHFYPKMPLGLIIPQSGSSLLYMIIWCCK